MKKKNLVRITMLVGLISVFTVFSTSCTKNNEMTGNPFFAQYDTPFEVPPFGDIEIGDYLPAFEKGIAQNRKEIESIANQAAEPTFDNTIVALEQGGQLLTKVSDVFYNLTSSNTNDSLQSISKIVTPQLSALSDFMYLNEALFARIKTLYEQRVNLGLNPEEMVLLEKYYKNF